MTEQLRAFFVGVEITAKKAQWLEDTGQAHVSGGASGGRPPGFEYRDVPEGPWMRLVPGPGNGWIEKQIGTCPECNHPWCEHLRPIWIRSDRNHDCINAPVAVYPSRSI